MGGCIFEYLSDLRSQRLVRALRLLKIVLGATRNASRVGAYIFLRGDKKVCEQHGVPGINGITLIKKMYEPCTKFRDPRINSLFGLSE